MASYDFRTNLKRSLKLALIFQIAWIIVFIIYALAGNSPSIGLLIVNLLILFAPALIEVVTRTKLPTAFQIHFYIFVTAASFLGSILEFYGSVPNWDTYVHVDSGVLIAWLGLFAVSRAENRAKGQLPKWFGVITAFMVPMALASLWEIYEFASDQILHTTMQAGGLEDTIVDMTAAIIGATIAIGIALLLKWPKSVLPKAFH